MKEVLNNQQIVCPGDATQFMHAIFSSDHEMYGAQYKMWHE